MEPCNIGGSKLPNEAGIINYKEINNIHFLLNIREAGGLLPDVLSIIYTPYKKEEVNG